MKYSYTAVVCLALLVSSCGVFKQHQQTYYVRQTNPEQRMPSLPELKVQVVPTRNDFHILFIIHSRKWVEPYSIRFSAYSKQPVDGPFLIHSFRLISGNERIAEEHYAPPMPLELTEKQSGEYVWYELDYRYELRELLQFEAGKEVELEVIYELPETEGKQTLQLKGKGEEENSKTSLWNAYMSI